MSWGAVAAAIYGVLSADTGSGGLLNSSSAAKVNAIVNGTPAKNATPPIVTFQSTGGSIEPVFEAANKSWEYAVQVEVYTLRSAGHTAHDPIVARVKSLLDRASLTVTGWTNGHSFLESEPNAAIDEGDVTRTTLIFSVFIATP